MPRIRSIGLFIIGLLFVGTQLRTSHCSMVVGKAAAASLLQKDAFKLPELGDFDDINFETVLTQTGQDDGGEDDGEDYSVKKIIPKINEPTIKAVALLGVGSTNGIVHFEQTGSGPTRVYGTIQGLSPGGQHGMHVHQYKSTSGDCSSAGDHYNPTNSEHGSPETDEAHVGDLGNIYANQKGIAEFDITSDRLSLTGKWSVINRSIVVHFNTDDLGRMPNRESKKNGNSGGRVSCGNIKFVSMQK